MKDRIHLIEQKTGKTKDFPISDTAAKAIKEYLGELNDDDCSDYLFQSRKGKGAISPCSGMEDFERGRGNAGLGKDSIGTHTMRKTFGYHAYKKAWILLLFRSC